jgi:hypothetical protein
MTTHTTGRCPHCRRRNCAECQPAPAPPTVFRFRAIIRVRLGDHVSLVPYSVRDTNEANARARLIRRAGMDFSDFVLLTLDCSPLKET